MRKFLLFSIALLFATLVSGQTLSRPQIAYPFDGNVLQGPLKTVRQTPQVTRTPDAFAPSTISAGGDRLVATQNSDGGWGWYLTGISANNTIGPIAKGLIQAYTGKYSSTQLAAFTKTKTFLLNKTNTFSATDGYLAKALDDIFGGTTCRDHVNTYYFGPLAAGTYNRNGEGTLYSTSSYVSYVLTSSGNLPGWYLGISLAGAVDCGVTGTELGYWISGVKTSIENITLGVDYDVLALASSLYGLASANEEFNPASGPFAAASNLQDLASDLASYQINNGGFAWRSDYVKPNDGDEEIQETAYSILALNKINRSNYLTKIRGAADYISSVQLATGGWENWVGSGEGENNEVTGEALWAYTTAYASVHNVTKDTWHVSIQAALDAAAANDMINVYPGNYSEAAVNRNTISLQGNNGPYQFGLFFDVTKPGISVIGVDASGNPITSYADVAATVTTNATNSFGYSGIFVNADDITIKGLKIIDNIVDNNVNNNKTIEIIGNNFTMQYCDVEVTEGGSIYLNDWNFASSTSTLTKYAILENKFGEGCSIDIASGAGYTGSVSDRTITGNYFDGTGCIYDVTWPSISFNGTCAGIGWFVDPVGGATISGNHFSNSPSYIRYRGTVAESQFNWANYWNDNTFDKAVITLSDETNFVPRAYSYSASGKNYSNVRRIGSVIQSDIDLVGNSGDIVKVAPGTYTEANQIVISKNLTITGADKATTIIKPAQGTVGSGYMEDNTSWILVNQGVTFNLNNVTLDGTGQEIVNAILSHGHGTIDNNIIKNMQRLSSYDGVGVALLGSDMTISNNTFSGIGREGVWAVFFSNATITGNTYTGKGIGDWLDYAFEVGRNSSATISGNTISENKGVASTDQSTSAGILVTSFYDVAGTHTNAIITGNVFSGTGNYQGIAVGYNENDVSTVIAHDNNFSGNTIAITTTAPIVNATCNYYGTTAASQIAAAIYGPVTYVPYQLSNGGACSAPCALALSHASTAVTCPSQNDGTVSVSVTGGGTGTYSYIWSTGAQTTSTVTGLVAGSYSVTVTDLNGCSATTTASVPVLTTGPVHNVTQGVYYCTIQAAINAANANDEIDVAAGTYTEANQIVINKNLTIVGADKATTIIKPAGSTSYGSAWISVGAGKSLDLSKVTLDGTGKLVYTALELQGSGTINDCNFTQIKYNESTNYKGTAIYINSTSTVNVTNCSFSEIGRNGILADQCLGTFSGNTYTGKGTGNWLDYFILSEYGDNVTISNNTISDCQGVASSDGSGSSAIAVWDDPSTQATITGNTMTNNSIGVAVVAYTGGTNDPKVVIGNGNLFDGGDYGVSFETWGPAYSPDVTFTGVSTFKGQLNSAIYINDGISAGSTIDISTAVFKTSGGSTITDNFAKEDLVVHAIDGTNRGLVRWNSTNLYVTSNSFVDPFTTPSIQRAMSVASDGDQVNVAAGTFVENGQVVINKNLSIVGADKATTIIKPAQNTGTDGDDRGWFLVSSDKTFNMSDVTLDGNGKLINIGILSHGHGTINNCILKNLGYNPSSDYAGRGVAFYNYNMTISNNTLSNIGRIGIYMNGTGITNATITGNTFTGKGPGDWLDYGIEVEGGANATITHNKVTDCKGIASVDNSGSAGFLATTYFAPGTQSTIEYNDFQNNSVDLAVGYDETDVTTVVAHNNSFTGSDFGVSTTAPPVNATCNWWGTANGNAIQTKTEGTVTYNGWLSSGGDSDSGPGFTPTGSCNGTPVAITLSSASNVSCPGTSTGAIDISVSGGSGSYAYTWSPTGASTQDLTGIAVGSYQVTVTDVTYGSTATLTQVIGTTNTLPGITTPSNQTLATAGGACTRTATWTPTVTGTPPPSVSYVFSGATTASASGDGSGSAFNKGVTYVTLTASNGCSPDATASFTITVNDTEKPSVSFANGTQNKDVALGTCAYPASSTEFDPTSVSDNCFGTTLGWALSGATTASGSTTLAGTSFHKGTTTVLWTVTDASSNTNTCTFNVVVTDPSNIYVNDASTTGDSFTYAAGNDGSGDGSKCSPYATVAHAVSVATSGSTIHVDAGTYDEQLVIDGKNLTIQGTGATTIIRPSAPSKLTAFHTYTTGVFPGWEGIVMAGVVVVKNTSSTTLKDFKVDGVNVTSLPTGSNRLAGVVFGESSGTIDNLTINTIKTTGYNDRTYGIDLSAVSGTHNIEVKNCSISDWARNGIQAMGASLTANIHNNVLVGPGTIGPANVPNGIVFIYQVGGNATSNDIRNSGYIGSQWKSAGIMVYGQVATGIILESNNIYNIDNAISLAMNSNDVIVRKNNLHNNEIGVHLEDGTTNNSITQNAINGNSIAGINLNNDGVPGTGNVAHYNNLSGNQTGTVNLDVTKTFDATSNYWGCPTTSGKVSYFSYYSSCSGDPGSFSFGPVVSNITAGATISSICSGSSTTIYASGGSDYVWSNSLGLGSSKVVSPTTSTTYSVTGKDSHGCAGAFASVSVTVSAAPTVTIENLVGGSGTVVLGNSRTLTAGGASSYLWNNGSTNNTITVSPTANTTYSVVGTTTGGCTGSTTYSITVASVSAGANRFICNGSNTVVAATVSGITATSYAWSAPGMTSQSFTASPQVTTTYTVTVNNDPSLHASVTIYVNPKPVANQGPNITIAPSGTGTLLGSASSGTAPYAYSWTTTGGSIIGSPNTPTPTVAAAGTYAILVTDAYGCSSNPASALVNIASSGYTVSGNVAYYLGAVNPQMHNVTVTLIGPSNFTTTTPATGNGNYQFLGIPNGTYTVYLSSSKPWGGVTSADIVAIQNHYKSPPTLLKGIKHIAADVMNPGTTATVIAEDRDLVNSRRLNPAVTFPNTGDWVFTRIDDAANDPASGPFIYANSIGFSNITLVVNNAIVSQDFRALCYGDVDASYTGVKDNENAVINFNTTNGLDLSNFPNPFAGQTTIRFTVPVEGKITVTVQTLLGAPVATINDPDDYEGIHNLTFNRQGLAPGVYLYTVRLKTSDDAFIQTGKMIIVN